MSSVFKSVAKVFKKVVKVVKKVAPFVLAAAAIYFTAGSALGVTAGFGATTSSAMTSLFGPGLLADTVAGAVTQAGYGALIGGGLSAITGGSITKGMQAGALTGALTGAATGFIGSPYTLANPSPTVGVPMGTGNMVAGGSTDPRLLGGSGDGTGGVNLGSPDYGSPTKLTYNPPVPPPPPGVPPVVPRSGLLGFWDEVKNSELASGIAGGVVKSIGGALLEPDPSTDRTDAAQLNINAATAARRAAYIGTGGTGGLLTESTKQASTAPTPGQQWGYGYDPVTGKITGV